MHCICNLGATPVTFLDFPTKVIFWRRKCIYFWISVQKFSRHPLKSHIFGLLFKTYISNLIRSMHLKPSPSGSDFPKFIKNIYSLTLSSTRWEAEQREDLIRAGELQDLRKIDQERISGANLPPTRTFSSKNLSKMWILSVRENQRSKSHSKNLSKQQVTIIWVVQLPRPEGDRPREEICTLLEHFQPPSKNLSK